MRDHATLLELAVLESDPEAVQKPLAEALANVRETWEPETTVNNLSLIREVRGKRGIDEPWLAEAITALKQGAAG